MAITISGSGITSANIADGTIVNADLANTTHRVLQVLHFETSTQVDNSTASWVDTGVTLSITPSATTSKIFITYSTQIFSRSTTQKIELNLLRGATSIQVPGYLGYVSAGNFMGSYSYTKLDSPATTSAVTYKVQFRDRYGTSITAQYDDTVGEGISTITLMEIGA